MRRGPDGKKEEVLGTKVSSDVLSTDQDTLFPLQGALGYELTQSLFLGKNTLPSLRGRQTCSTSRRSRRSCEVEGRHHWIRIG